MSADLRSLYESGASSRELAKLFGVARQTIISRLRRAGVEVRDRGPANNPPSRQVHRIVKQLHDLLGHNHRWAVERSGMSLSWWRSTRSGEYTPTLNSIEALANAAGYEIVLRRRMAHP